MAQALAAAGGEGHDRRRAGRPRGRDREGLGGQATHLDVSDEASWEAAVAATVEQLGGLDILVNNAGIEISGLIVDAEAADLRRMLEVNVLGTALGIKHGLRAMRLGGPAGNGAIVNISSVAATIAFPGIAGYSATKSAVDRLTRVAAFRGRQARLRRARELRLSRGSCRPRWARSSPSTWPTRPVREPGGRGRRRDRADSGRPVGQVSDMADAVVFLASDQARFITGAGLPVDGGMGCEARRLHLG